MMTSVPYAILAMYFLHSFAQTFPMTAYGEWLFQVIHMPPATTTLYYSMSFFPWNLKPLYGLISDNFPIHGYRRKSYIVLCEIGAASSLFITGICITTITGAFIVKISDAVFEAFSQIMLGILLVDLTAGDRTSTGSASVQSWANGAKNAASILAMLVGIPVYKNKSIRPQQVICWTSIFPLIAALVCTFRLYEPQMVTSKETTLETPNRRSCRQVISKSWQSFRQDVTKKAKIIAPVLPTMVFFCLSSALPSDGMVWYQYTFSLLEKQPECLQYASLAGMVGRFLSCIMYAKVCSGRNVRHVFIASTVSSVLGGLPKLLLTPPVATLPVSICTFGSIEAFITSFTGEFALLQLLVVATFYCPEEKSVHGLTYALYLSFMDFGGVLSGVISSMVVSFLSIVPDPKTHSVNWDNLWLLVVISSLCQLLVLAFLYVLPEKVHHDMEPVDLTTEMGTEYEPLLAVENR